MREETHMDDTTFSIDVLSELFYQNLLETEDFGNHLEHVSTLGPFIMRAAFIKNLQRFDDELMASVPHSWTLQDKRQRTIITLMGEIVYSRRIYIDEYGFRRYLLDEVLGISSYQRIDPAAFIWIVHMASNISFEKTAKAFFKATGVKICRQTVMRCVHREGELLAKMPLASSSSRISTPVLYMEFDGIHINLQSEKKSKVRICRTTYKAQYLKKSVEMKVGVIYAGKAEGCRIGCYHWMSSSTPEDFFKSGMTLAESVYDTDEIDYLHVASDAASWCKNHGLQAEVSKGTVVISTLDRYHINQRVYKAFTKEEDRSLYLSLLYGKDYDGFFKALDERIKTEPDRRLEQRVDLYAYIKNNLDWLSAPSLTRLMRERLLSEIAAVFGSRSFYDHLYTLLSKRRYKRFIQDLGKIVSRCTKNLYADYCCFLEDAKEAIRLIKLYGRMGLGTMEGTNSKVYAARLKVWGCTWSRRGAEAMMRIRAHLASGLELIAPSYRGWLSDKEMKQREKHCLKSSAEIGTSSGRGYEPPQGQFSFPLSVPPKLYGIVMNR